jgi:hypothetical protein
VQLWCWLQMAALVGSMPVEVPKRGCGCMHVWGDSVPICPTAAAAALVSARVAGEGGGHLGQGCAGDNLGIGGPQLALRIELGQVVPHACGRRRAEGHPKRGLKGLEKPGLQGRTKTYGIWEGPATGHP